MLSSVISFASFVRDHWNNVYENADATELGWYDPDLAQSLRLIDRRGLSTDDLVIDVGAGTSSLIHSFPHVCLLAAQDLPKSGVQNRKKMEEARASAR